MDENLILCIPFFLTHPVLTVVGLAWCWGSIQLNGYKYILTVSPNYSTKPHGSPCVKLLIRVSIPKQQNDFFKLLDV